MRLRRLIQYLQFLYLFQFLCCLQSLCFQFMTLQCQFPLCSLLQCLRSMHLMLILQLIITLSTVSSFSVLSVPDSSVPVSSLLSSSVPPPHAANANTPTNDATVKSFFIMNSSSLK